MRLLKYIAFEQAEGLATLLDEDASKYTLSLRSEPGFELPPDRRLVYLIEPEPMHVEVFVNGHQAREGRDFHYQGNWIVWTPAGLTTGSEVRVRCYAKKD